MWNRQRKIEHCNSVRSGCLAPPAWQGKTGLECYVCALGVCMNCSTVREYLHFGEVRICADCLVELKKDPTVEVLEDKIITK